MKKVLIWTAAAILTLTVSVRAAEVPEDLSQHHNIAQSFQTVLFRKAGRRDVKSFDIRPVCAFFNKRGVDKHPSARLDRINKPVK